MIKVQTNEDYNNVMRDGRAARPDMGWADDGFPVCYVTYGVLHRGFREYFFVLGARE